MIKVSKMVAALAATLIVAAVYLVSFSESNAQDAPKQQTHGPFQISAWSRAGSAGNAPMSGAYIIDSETGKVWSVINDNEPKEIGILKR